MCQISERKNESVYYFTTDTSPVTGERRTGSVDGATPVSSRRTFQQDCRNNGSRRIKKKSNTLFPPPFFLPFCGPCIMIYLRNEDQQDALFSLNLFQ